MPQDAPKPNLSSLEANYLGMYFLEGVGYSSQYAPTIKGTFHVQYHFIEHPWRQNEIMLMDGMEHKFDYKWRGSVPKQHRGRGDELAQRE
jgi:hypothetical protein